VITVMKFQVHKTREILCFARKFQLLENVYIKLVGFVGWLVGWLVGYVGRLILLVGWFVVLFC